MKGGLDIVTGGTDTHVMLVDLRPKGVKGNQADKALGRANITTNKNGIPFDPEKPMVTSWVEVRHTSRNNSWFQRRGLQNNCKMDCSSG